MSYTPKTNWQYNEVLTEQDMNRIETGIGASQEQLDTHLAARNNPHGVTTDQIGAETPTGAQAKVDAHANAATAAHKASAISLDDAGNNFTATDLEGAMVELFSSVSNGKSLVATAITGKGGTVAGTAPYTFQDLANSVDRIVPGKKMVATSTPIPNGAKNVVINGLGFTPKVVLVHASYLNSTGSRGYAHITFKDNYNNTSYTAWTLTNSTATGNYTGSDLAINSDGFTFPLVETTMGTSGVLKWTAIE